jgi:predicted nucleic acid-binding Zn ribbon protein
MIRERDDFEEDDDDASDDPLPQDMDDDDVESALPMMSCPHCRGAVVEDTQQCPHCGEWITAVERRGGRGWLYIFAILLMLGIVLMWSLR